MSATGKWKRGPRQDGTAGGELICDGKLSVTTKGSYKRQSSNVLGLETAVLMTKQGEVMEILIGC